MNFEQGAFSQIPEEPKKNEADLNLPEKGEDGVLGRLKKGFNKLVGVGVVGGALLGVSNDAEAISYGLDSASTNTPSNSIEIGSTKIDSLSIVKLADHFKQEVDSVLAQETSGVSIQVFNKILKDGRDLKNKLATFNLKTVDPKERGAWNKSVGEVQKLLIVLGQTARAIGQDIWSNIEQQGLNGVKPSDREKIAPIRDDAQMWFGVQKTAEDLANQQLSRYLFSRHDVEQGALGVK